MCSHRVCLLWILILAVGCGGGEVSAPNNVNPYASNPTPQPGTGAPAPSQPRPVSRPQSSASREVTTTDSGPPQAIEIPKPGYAAEMAVPLSFVEYARFARLSADMLGEMTKIHAAVSESADAEPYQERWGQLTAEHTSLAREVANSAYPPVEIARDLNRSAIPKLHQELQYAASVMQEYDDLEGGLAQPFAQAQQIYDHLTENLSAAEVASQPGISLPGNPQIIESPPASADSPIEPAATDPASAPRSDSGDSTSSASPFRPANPSTLSTGSNSTAMTRGNSPFRPADPLEPAASTDDTPLPDRNIDNLAVDRSTQDPWRVKVDPPGQTLSLDSDARLGIKVPGQRASGDAGVTYPHTPGPFVLLGTNSSAGQTSEIWNLETRRKVGKVKGLALGSSQRITLRGDGKYLAAQPTHEGLIGVWDVDGEKPLGALPIKKWAGADFIGFGTGSRLIVVDGDDLVIAILPELREERRATLPSWRSDTSYAVSPGERYLAFHADAAVRIYDLTICQQVGSLPMDKSVQGVRFSDDGTELAALYDDHFDECGIAIWDVASGQQKSEILFEKGLEDLVQPNPGYRGPQLQWFPDRTLMLIAGCGVVDRGSGQLLVTLPAKVKYAVAPIGPRQVGVVKGADYDRFVITDEQIAKSQTIAEAGGKQIDVLLPPLTATDRSTIQSISVLTEANIPWGVSAEMLGGGIVETRAQSSITIPSGQVYRGSMSSPAASRIALMYTGVPVRTRTSSGWGLEPTRTRVQIELYDTRRSRKLTTYELPFTTTLESLSPDGTLALTRIADGMDRLDVWNLDEKSHVAAIRPYAHLGEDSRDRDVQAAAFIDDEHVLTMNNSSITLYELSGKAVYEINLEGVGRPVVSPSRRFIALLDGPNQAVEIFNSLTGQQVGAVNCSRAPSGCGFHPAGDRLAVLIGNQTGGEVMIVGMADGQVIDQFPVPRSGSLVQWMGDEHLLVGGDQRFRQDNIYLISVPRRMVVWNYALPFGMHIWDSADGRHWYLSASDRNARSFAVNALALPEPDVGKFLDEHATTPELVLEPGGGIDVLVNVQDPPEESDFADRVRRNLISRYREAGVNVVEGHSLVLSVTGSSGATGRTMQFGRLHGGFDTNTVSLSEEEVRWDIAITRDGALIWENHLRYSNGGMIWLQEGEEVSSKAGNQMWASAVNGLLDYSPPVYVFPAEARDGLGASILTPRGSSTKFRPTE